MPIALSNKHRIHYQIEGDKGPFILLYPPLLGSVQSWYDLDYIERLQEFFRIILIDPLGQGRSDAPLISAQYTLEARGEHILDIMNELNVANFHFLGMGLGAQVGFYMVSNFPKQIRSLITVGEHPYAITTEIKKVQSWIQQLRTEGIVVFIEGQKQIEDISPMREERLKQGEAEAYALALQAICEWSGIGEQLPQILAPGLLFTTTGEEKFLAIREAGRLMPRSRYVIMPELNYKDGLVEADIIVPSLLDFIRKQRRNE